jgi:arylsulfatase A-like enzyme
MRDTTRWLAVVAGLLLIGSHPARAADPPPNLVLIFCDDLGYGDLGCTGAEGYATPNVDRLAREGVRLTDFYVSSAVCSASRAALMTGCYHERVSIRGALGPTAKIGLSRRETTIAEMLKSRGYATGMAGKWHLGARPSQLPVHHGFDEYLGLPYSNDMWPHHPERPDGYPNLPLIEGDRVVDPDVTADDQKSLTGAYTRRAVEFIRKNRDRPFFFYLAHSMPHVPLFRSDAFAGKTGRGAFGDVIAEIDAGVGEILRTLDELDLAGRTLVVFTSDNGPWLSYGDHAGSAGPLREGKGTSFEGGIREPFLARWPGRIPAGSTCGEVAATIDLLPTFAAIAGASPPDLPIDGKDITPLLLATPGARSPHEALGIWYDGSLQAVRSGPWKLLLPHESRTMKGQAPGRGGVPGTYRKLAVGLELYNLADDPGEARDVADAHPEVVARLRARADAMRRELGDAGMNIRGTAVRPPDRGEGAP